MSQPETAHSRVLDREQSVLVVIDVQESYRGKTVHEERMRTGVRRLIEAARVFAIPVLATEQYPKGLGHFMPEVAEAFAADQEIVEKRSMSCLGAPAFVERLRALQRRHVVVCGIEAHACVNQTVHDLLEQGYHVHVPYDAISARFEHDYRIAWEKMTGSGAIPTTVEMACLEWVRTAEAPEFKAIQKIIK